MVKCIEEGRRKKQEGRSKKQEARRKNKKEAGEKGGQKSGFFGKIFAVALRLGEKPSFFGFDT
ncbi:MAG: hypothetical protein HC789_18630 [Microcoleus sp. CSU_2_2]|nr:hypothetical protein [Microcoleus sp. SU_5_3]NJS12241.1 hypothetical protein [Microcoleus sp. CSU_2_2]